MKKIFYTIFILFCVVLITGCNSQKENKDNTMDKYEQLSNYLINNGWEKNENSQDDFTLTIRNILDDDGKPTNVDQYFLNIKKMNIQRITRISQLSATTTDYSLKSNIATGTYILLNEKDEWDKYVSFTYDFNSSSLTTDDNSSSSLCTNQSIGLKEKLEELLEEANLRVEDFK